MSYENYEMRIADLEEQVAELEKENKKYREALEIYAEATNWWYGYEFQGGDERASSYARQALNK